MAAHSLSDYKRPSTPKVVPSIQYHSSYFNYTFSTQSQQLTSCLNLRETPTSGSTKVLRTPISAWIPVRKSKQPNFMTSTNNIAEDERSIANRLAAEEVRWQHQS